METSSSPDRIISELYRFAILLTADHALAGSALIEVLSDATGRLAEIRTDKARTLWLVGRVRECCLRSAGPAGEQDGEVPGIARHFHSMAEPGRSAAALFYLDLLAVEDVAQLLGMSLEQLSSSMAGTRGVLWGSGAVVDQ